MLSSESRSSMTTVQSNDCQVPALALPSVDVEQGIRAEGEHGITLVISPLIALMKDQVCDIRLPPDMRGGEAGRLC